MRISTVGSAGWRSILFVPGDRPDRYARAVGSAADAVCIDLEDAVAPGRKAAARASVAAFLARRATATPGQRTATGSETARQPAILVRMNDPRCEEGERDAAALRTGSRPDASPGAVPPPDAFMVPKVQGADGVRSARRLLGASTPLLPLIETAWGLHRVADIAMAGADPNAGAAPERRPGPPAERSRRAVAGLVFGGFDLSAELGAEPDWETLLCARSRVVHAAALAGIPAFDMPSRDLGASDALRREAEGARRLGFVGKVAIHPAQVPVIHDVFTPSPEEMRRARSIVEADRVAGGGAVALDGAMVDRPVVEAARRVLARGRAIP